MFHPSRSLYSSLGCDPNFLSYLNIWGFMSPSFTLTFQRVPSLIGTHASHSPLLSNSQGPPTSNIACPPLLPKQYDKQKRWDAHQSSQRHSRSLDRKLLHHPIQSFAQFREGLCKLINLRHCCRLLLCGGCNLFGGRCILACDAGNLLCTCNDLTRIL